MKRKLVKEAPHQKYFLRDGSQVTGASTIAKFGEDPGPLIAWANKEGLAGRDHRQGRDLAADSGTIAHALSEAYLIGDELDLSDFSQESIDFGTIAFEKFKEWWETGGYTFLYSELQLNSENHRFGGTLDILCKKKKKKVLVDLKATKSLRTSHLIQVIGGYLTLENENRPEEPIDEVCILRLPKEEGKKVEELWAEPKHFPLYQKVFLANLSAMEARKELDKVDPIVKRYRSWKRK